MDIKVTLKDDSNNTYSLKTKAAAIEQDDNNQFINLNQKNILNSISNPNLLINGDFQVWQRGEVFETQKRGYTADRWYGYTWSDGGPFTAKKSENGIMVKVLNNIGNAGFSQLIEMSDTIKSKLQGKNFTISSKVNNTFIYTTGIFNFNKGTFLNVFNNEIGIRFIMEDKIGYISFRFTIYDEEPREFEYIKIEIGNEPTPFIPRRYAEELELCKRYYQRIGNDTEWYIIGICEQAIMAPIHFSQMRTIPKAKIISEFRIEDSGNSIPTTDLNPRLNYIKDNYLLVGIDKPSDIERFKENTSCLIHNGVIELDAELY